MDSFEGISPPESAIGGDRVKKALELFGGPKPKSKLGRVLDNSFKLLTDAAIKQLPPRSG